MWARLQRIRRAALLREQADKNLLIAQRWYNEQYKKRVTLAPIFKKGDNIFLNRPPLFQPAAESSAAKGYNKLLQAKQEPYEVFDVVENPLEVIQDGLENTI